MNEFVIGVLSGLFTGFIVWVTREFLYPQVIGFANKVPKISGTWVLYNSSEKNANPISRITISQFGTRIRATSARIRSGRCFKYRGTFDSGILTLVFEEVGGEWYIVGTTVVKLSSNRQVLEGQSIYYKHNTETIVNIPRYYKRENSS